MIDLENEKIKGLIEETKRKMEREILKLFNCEIIPLYLGEPIEGFYRIAINYETIGDSYGFPKGYCMVSQVIIPETDYDKYKEE